MSATKSILTVLAAAALLGVLAGCSSSDPVAPVDLVDTAPPAVPTSLTATVAMTVVKLRWDPNTVDADLAGYRVYELVGDGSHLLTETPVQEARWVDHYPPLGPCNYAVAAVDAAGNESAWQTVNYAGLPVPPQRRAAP